MSRPDVHWIPANSHNYSTYREHSVDSIVLHNTDGSLQAAIATFKNPESQVSAHYIVARDGSCYQMVLEGHTAWHAGNRPMNHRSIGIENVADENNQGFTPEQEKCLIDLIGYLKEKYKIDNAYIHTHRQVISIRGGTDCPGWLWDTEGKFNTWKGTHIS